VFVLGSARSGTSLMCRLLLDHLGVNFGSESQFIVRHHQRLTKYGDLRDDRCLRWLFEEISRERFFERTRNNFGFVFDIDEAVRTIEHRTYAGALRTIFEQFARSKGLPRWGDKTPAYCRHLPVLHELFPAAQYIHVVRDGRDVAVSAFQAGFGPKNGFEAASDWTELVRTIERFGATLPPTAFITIRYEDVLSDPAAQLGRIAQFLGIANHEELRHAIAGPVRARVWPNNAGKSLLLLSARENECFEASAADVLDAYGYPLRFRRRTRPLSRTEMIYWRAQGMWKRAVNTEYWADNCYKLGLRLRRATLDLRRPTRTWRWWSLPRANRSGTTVRTHP